MSVMYSTVTAKGQITLPAPLRQRFGFRPGLKVVITADEHGVRVEAPPSLEQVRTTIEAQMRRNGTWGGPVDPHQAWVDDAVERHT